MTHYKVSFTGRKAGAIGIAHRCTVHVVADSVEQAKLKAYDTHDHIMFPEVTEIVVASERDAQIAISGWCRSFDGARQGAVMREVGGRPHVLDIRPRIAKTIASGDTWLDVARAMGFRSEPGSGEAG